jgi:hypothetical protein
MRPSGAAAELELARATVEPEEELGGQRGFSAQGQQRGV